MSKLKLLLLWLFTPLFFGVSFADTFTWYVDWYSSSFYHQKFNSATASYKFLSFPNSNCTFDLSVQTTINFCNYINTNDFLFWIRFDIPFLNTVWNSNWDTTFSNSTTTFSANNKVWYWNCVSFTFSPYSTYYFFTWFTSNLYVYANSSTFPFEVDSFDLNWYFTVSSSSLHCFSSSVSSDCSSSESDLSTCISDLSALSWNYSSLQSSYYQLESNYTSCQSWLNSCLSDNSHCDTLVGVCYENLSGCVSDLNNLQNYNDSLNSQLNECLINGGSGSILTWFVPDFSLYWSDYGSDYSLPITNNLFLPIWYKWFINDWVLSIQRANSLDYAFSMSDSEFKNWVVNSISTVFLFIFGSWLFLVFLYAIRYYFIWLKS